MRRTRKKTRKTSSTMEAKRPDRARYNKKERPVCLPASLFYDIIKLFSGIKYLGMSDLDKFDIEDKG